MATGYCSSQEWQQGTALVRNGKGYCPCQEWQRVLPHGFACRKPCQEYIARGYFPSQEWQQGTGYRLGLWETMSGMATGYRATGLSTVQTWVKNGQGWSHCLSTANLRKELLGDSHTACPMQTRLKYSLDDTVTLLAL